MWLFGIYSKNAIGSMNLADVVNCSLGLGFRVMSLSERDIMILYTCYYHATIILLNLLFIYIYFDGYVPLNLRIKKNEVDHHL